jgi:parallel beta-helix repeat protein
VRLVITTTLVMLLLATPATAADRYVSTTGSDWNACTSAAPCRTIPRGVAAAAPGDRVLVAAGTYGAIGQTTRVARSSGGTSSAPKTVMPAVGAAVTQRGHFDIDASYVRFTRLTFLGPTGNLGGNGINGEQVLVAVNGTGVEIDHSTIRGGRGHAGIYGSGASYARLHHNWVVDNGNRADANRDHGIYWSSGTGARIENNLIEANVARGVQLYPSATATVVNGNTIVNNGGSGVQFGESATGNLIANNVIAGNGHTRNQPGVYNYDSSGTNAVRNNVVYGNRGGSIVGARLTSTGNVFANPLFESAVLGSFSTGNDFHIESTSPARGLADTGAPVTDFEDQTRDGDPDAGYDEHNLSGL